MSGFGFYEKDAVVDAIEGLVAKELGDGKNTAEVIESILEAASYGIRAMLYSSKYQGHKP